MGSKNKQNKKSNNNKPTVVVAAAPKPDNNNNKPVVPAADASPTIKAVATPKGLPDSPKEHGDRPPGTAVTNHNEIVVIEDEDAHHDEMAEMEMLPQAGSDASFDSSSTADAIKYTRAEATLRTIEESLSDIKSLLRSGEYISAREIALLRSSLVYLLSDHKKLASTEMGKACLQDLHDVEFSVLGAQDAQTGDSESLTPLGFGENMQPILATTVNRLQAKREADLAAKKKKKEGKKSVPSTPLVKPTQATNTKKGSDNNNSTKKPSAATSSPKLSPTSPKVAPSSSKSNNNNNKPSKDTTNSGSKGEGTTANNSNKPPAWKFVNIPPRRRLQTLVMSCMLFFTGVPAAIFLAVILLMIPVTMPFMVAYILYMLYSQMFLIRHPLKPYTGWTQSTFLQIYKDYFPCRLSIPRDYRPQFDRKRNYMFICHPHGVHSFGVVCCFGADVQGISNMIPGIKIHAQTLGINFWIPFWRQLTIWGGCGDASAGCIRKTLRSGPGESIALVVGGAAESLLSSPKTNILCLKNRMGFVKISLETGSPLVPVFSFGETNVYYNFAQGSPLLKKILVSIQKRIGFAIPLISGRGWFNYNFGILPHRRPIIVVVGEPLEMPQIPNPTREEVSYWHAKYIDALKAHYEKHKAVYDVEGTLEIE